jgi:hypothetical protein
MDPTRIVLAACWVSLMLIYLLGDVLRIFAGHFTPGRMVGREAAGWMWTVAAVVMLLPIVMILVSLLVPATPLVWITVIVAAFLVLFNLSGLPYQGFYDNMLIVVGILLNGVTIWQALAWRPEATVSG